MQSHRTGQDYGAGQSSSISQSYEAAQNSSASQSYTAAQNSSGSQEYGTSQTYNTVNGGWHQFGDFRDWNGVAIQNYGDSENDGAMPSHDTYQNYSANHDYGDSLLYNAGNGSWRESGHGLDEDLNWNGIAIQDDGASQDYGDSLRDSTGSGGWYQFDDGRDMDSTWSGSADQDDDASLQRDGHDLNYNTHNSDWPELHSDRDEDWNGRAFQTYGRSRSEVASRDHDASQSYGHDRNNDTDDGGWPKFHGDRDEGLGRKRDAPREFAKAWYKLTHREEYGNGQSNGTGQELAARQEHSDSLENDAHPSHGIRQNYGVSTDYGDSRGDVGWRGFDDRRDEGVDWGGTALQDHDVARCDADLRNRGEGWGKDELGGGVRRVDERAEVDRVGGPAGSAERTGRKRRGGAHRVPAPPRALKGRAAVIAVAVGAIVAAGQNWAPGSEKSPRTAELQAVGQQQAVEPVSGALPTTPELLDTAIPTNLGQFSDVLENGDKFAQDLAAEAEAKLRPLFMKFASGSFTSGYGERWGVLHPGVDVAAPIGTPIYAVEDGTVIDAGPAAGFGMWVRMRGDDGTITVYGHINTALVSVGQHVIAGDEIATVGNRGESTGPHCHFEVWLNGTDRIDPLPWLATRGISLGQERD